MKTLLIGANGQLGTDIQASWPQTDVVPLTRGNIDVTDRERVFDVIAAHAPDLVLNTTAFHAVDVCETEPDKAFATNAAAVKHLADACAEHGSALMHISTDYVFNGRAREPYAEDAPTDSTGVYGISKAAGEQVLRAALPRHYIVRTSGLFGVAGAAGKGGNFVETMLRLAPTFTGDLAPKLLEVARTGRFGTYHITASGDCSWYEFARAIFELAGLQPDLSPTTSAEFAAKAPRPAYSVLANNALAAAGIAPLRHWREALADYLVRKRHVTPAATGR
jgi:dTDP-4-dehydrorhamnose reductase